MSLGVQSYPELYTVLLGWDLYGKLWALLMQTGLAYLPFIGIVLKNMTQFYSLQGRHGAEGALRSMEVHLLTASLLIFFGVAPLVPLDAHTVSFTPLCEKGKTYYPTVTGTTYDKAFAVPSSAIRVPLWWYAVLSVSEGMTSAANTMVGCVPDLRKMITEVDMTQLSDPELKLELQDFAAMCYAPAKMRFFDDTTKNTLEHTQRIQDKLHQYGVEDTEWIGSHAFNAVYYPHLNATRPVPLFRYDKTQDINATNDEVNPPAYGMPSCYDWWNSTQGLKNRLYQALPKSFAEEFKGYLKTPQAQDDLLKKIMSNAPRGYQGYDSANDLIGELGYSHLASALGTLYNQFEEYPKLYAAGQAAPIIQALLLLMVYVFLPFALVFSGYKPMAFLAGAILIFSIIFWAFIWHLVSWADKALIEALYANWFARQGAGATLADMIIGTLVVAAPLFWFSFMGAMGVMVSDIVGPVMPKLNRVSEQAVQGGPSMVGQVATVAIEAAAELV